MSPQSLRIDGTHTVVAELYNPSSAPYIYMWQDFSVQLWVRTDPRGGGVIASNQQARRDMTGITAAQPSFGYWSLTANSDGSLTFDVTWLKYVAPGAQGRSSVPESYPYYEFKGALTTSTSLVQKDGTHAPLNDGNWHRVEAIREGYRLTLFVDGVLAGVLSTESTFASGPTPYITDPARPPEAPALVPDIHTFGAAPLYVGWDAALSGGSLANNHFNGHIDDLRIWGRAFSAADLASWAQLAPTVDISPDLLGRWSFDDDTSKSPMDSSGRGQLGAWRGGAPKYGPPGFIPAAPKYLRLSGSGSCAKFADDHYAFSGPFTVQAWVRPDPGQVGPLISHQNTTGGWTLLSEQDGSATLFIRTSAGDYAVTSPPAGLFDGQWHQVTAVRDTQELRLYIDGRPAGVSKYNSIAAASTKVGALYLGASPSGSSYAHRSPKYNASPTGCFDEVRLWSRALSQPEIASTLFLPADTSDHYLVGYFQFDQGNLRDSSIYCVPTLASAGVTFEDAPFNLTPTAQPYLMAQSCLMQEFEDTGSSLKEVTSYRVTLTARDGLDGARPSTLTLWSDETVEIYHGKSRATLDTGSRLKVETNGLGQFIFSIRATLSSSDNSEDRLYCPAIYAHADFMSDTQQLHVSPDRQLHAKLATVSGSTLRSSVNGEPPLLDSRFDANQADAIAGAINDIMAAAAHNSAQVANGTDVSAYRTTSAAMARDVAALTQGLPTQPLYTSRKAHVVSANPATHLVRTNYLPIPVAVDRVAGAAYRPAQITRFDFTTGQFGAVSPDQVQAQLEQCEEVLTPEQVQAMTRSRSLSSLWDDFKRGALQVVHSFVETVSSAASKLQATIVYLVHGVQQAFQYVVTKLEDAADYLKGLLSSLSILPTRILRFFRAVFSWEQYRPAYDIAMTCTDQLYRGFKDGLRGVNAVLDAKLMTFKDRVLRSLDDFIGNPIFSGVTLQSGGGQALAQPLGDVQSGYLSSVLTAHSDQLPLMPTHSAGGPVPDVPDVSQNPELMNLLKLISDPRGIMALSLSDLAVALKGVVNWLFNAIASATDRVFGLIEGALDWVWQTLNAALPQIPILSNLFKQLKVPFTPRSILCMMGAVTANLTFKAATANASASLGTSQMAAQLQSSDWVYKKLMGVYAGIPGFPPMAARAKSEELEDADKALLIMGYVFSGVYTAANTVWGFFAVAADLETAMERISKVPNMSPSPIIHWRLVAGLITNIAAFPFMIFTSDFSEPSTGCELALWFVYAGAMVLDLALAYMGFGANSPGAYVGTTLTVGFGLAALANTIVLMVFDALAVGGDAAAITDLVLKCVQNVLGTLTLISQLGFLIPVGGPGTAIANFVPAAIDAASYFGASIINVVRLGGDMSRSMPEVVR